MSSDARLRLEDLLEPGSRLPVGLCLDVSDSMSGEPMTQLNTGVQFFFDALKEDRITRSSAEVAIVAFADSAAVLLDFQSLERVTAPPVLATKTDLGIRTNLGAGASMTLDVLQARKRDYQQAGVDYFQPFFVLMTDGQPTTQEHVQAAERIKALEADRKLVVMPIGIGPNADMQVLQMFSGKNQPLRLQGLKFREFFDWLGLSVKRVSQSRPGERTPLDTQGIKGWAEV